jgi:hypothetical protein
MPKRVSRASGKKSNGHKKSRSFPNCMNMKKKGGSEEEVIVENDEIFEPGEIEEDVITGGKKSNRSTKRRKSRRNRRTRRRTHRR